MPTKLCDFCSKPNPEWYYDCDEFTLDVGPVVLGSDNKWAACEACKKLIDNGKRDQLFTRTLLSADPETWDAVIEGVPFFHGLFFKHKRGEAKPIQ